MRSQCSEASHRESVEHMSDRQIAHEAAKSGELTGGAVFLSPGWRSPVLTGCKRIIDVVVSGAMLVVLAPLFLILACAVKLTSRGRIFHPWRVVGEDGRPFLGYKFRSMYENADELKAQLEPRNEMRGPVFKLTDDPRVTPLGRFLRKYSLDELPQLWSVLKGDMSLVGPRPPLQTEFENFSDFHKKKLLVKPGITCLWQVCGRNDIKDFDDWVKLDLEYIQNWSLWLDFRILLRTVPAVISGKGR